MSRPPSPTNSSATVFWVIADALITSAPLPALIISLSPAARRKSFKTIATAVWPFQTASTFTSDASTVSCDKVKISFNAVPLMITVSALLSVVPSRDAEVPMYPGPSTAKSSSMIRRFTPWPEISSMMTVSFPPSSWICTVPTPPLTVAPRVLSALRMTTDPLDSRAVSALDEPVTYSVSAEPVPLTVRIPAAFKARKIRSASAPPSMVSLPSPPSISSTPLPPKMMSLFGPPKMMSAPSPP